MRKIIIKRLTSIKFQTDNFNHTLTKWENFNIRGNHISETNFNALSDVELLTIFERVIIRTSKHG